MPLNLSIFRAINQWPEWLAPTMHFFSEATNLTWVKWSLVLLLIAMIAWRADTRRAAVQALVAFPIANEVTDFFKNGIPMPRPFQDLPDVILRAGASDSMGTASAHSANMAAVAVVFTYHLKWWGSPWVAIAFLTGLSRIYNGVHYPYQVLLGWLCGGLVAYGVCRLWDFIVAKRTPVVNEENQVEIPN